MLNGLAYEIDSSGLESFQGSIMITVVTVGSLSKLVLCMIGQPIPKRITIMKERKREREARPGIC